MCVHSYKNMVMLQNETWQAVVLQHPTVPPQYELLTLDKVRV